MNMIDPDQWHIYEGAGAEAGAGGGIGPTWMENGVETWQSQ